MILFLCQSVCECCMRYLQPRILMQTIRYLSNTYMTYMFQWQSNNSCIEESLDKTDILCLNSSPL